MRKQGFIHRMTGWLSLLLVALMLSTSLPTETFASGSPPAVNGDESITSVCAFFRKSIALLDGDDVWLTEYIVTCIKYTITNAFLQFLTAFYGAVEMPIRAAMTLSIVLFGGLILGGMIEKPARDSFIFLMKLASVTAFVQVSSAVWFFESSIATMDSLTDAVFTVGEMDGGGYRCPDTATLWDEVDCMLDVLIGIRKAIPSEGITADKNEVSPDKFGISRGMMHFFFSNLSSSGAGAVIAALGLYTCFALVVALIKSIHTYLAAILALAFIFMMTPMFVPLILFKATRNYFDKWYRIAISFILQPVILFAFLSFMMVSIDTLLVSGSNSVLKMIMGDNCEKQVISECLEEEGAFVNKSLKQYRQVTRNAGIERALVGTDEGAARGSRTTRQGVKLTDADKKGLSAVERPFEGLDYAKLAVVMGAADDGEAKERLAYAAIITALTMFVFISMLNYIPVMATDLAGGVFEVPNLYEKVGANFLGADQTEKLAHSASSKIRGTMDGTLKQFENMITRRPSS